MSETKHTPGPWEISPVRTHDGNSMVVGGMDRAFGLVAECVVDEDARLIAAAPEMLDALLQAQIYIEADEAVHGRQFGDGNAIRAAIAKATGAA